LLQYRDVVEAMSLEQLARLPLDVAGMMIADAMHQQDHRHLSGDCPLRMISHLRV
jgi:hypothetical protein